MTALLSFAADCCQLRTFEDFVPHLVTILAKLIPAAHVTYNEMNPRTSTSHNWVNTAELAAPAAGELWQQHMNEHPVMVHFLRTGSRRAVRISDFWSPHELHNRGLYYDFYRRFDIEDVLCLVIPSPAPIVIGVGWHDDRRFTGREKLIGELVRPHIAQALRNARWVSHSKSQFKLLNDGVESTGCAAVVCTSSGRIRRTSELGRRHIAKYFGLTQGLDRWLPDELRGWMRREQAMISGNGIPLARSPMVLEKNGRRLIIRLLAQAEQYLLLMKEETLAPNVCDIEKLGLTRRQAEVLLCVSQGKTNKEAAVFLSMNSRTVQKHLEHIFEKLSVDTRTAAAAVAFAAASNSEPRPTEEYQ